MKLNQFSIGGRLATTFGLVVLITASLAIVATLLVESIKRDIQHEAEVLERGHNVLDGQARGRGNGRNGDGGVGRL